MDIPVQPWVDITQWSLLVGALTPLVVAFLKQSTLSRTVNTAIAVVFSVIAAFVTVIANGDFEVDKWAASAIAIYTVAGAFYKNLYEPFGEQRLQDATTVYKRDELASRRQANYNGSPPAGSGDVAA